ncbi:cutinase [Tothia fuscella]|uniref:Cutinase n=1 Tax=Tothia fuscella TaxID=1048955 RepID=A0A9P4NH66_9PEZI|nr:cutinase [Tothia fuscella]
MKALIASFLFAALTLASPIQVRQNTGLTENEYTRGGCRDVIFFFARGSTEVGNMGSTVGPPTSDGLKQAFGSSNVATEGIDYDAALATNFNPGGADYAGIRELEDLLDRAASRCPNSKIVVSGYSQGAALVHRAVEDRSAAVKAKIVGVVTYGDTQNLQDRGRVPNFPSEKLLIICNAGDLVCSGTLTITAAHLAYEPRVGQAVAFLTGRIRAG